MRALKRAILRTGLIALSIIALMWLNRLPIMTTANRGNGTPEYIYSVGSWTFGEPVPQDEYRVFWPDGSLRMRGTYCEGLREGQWVTYFEHGGVSRCETFVEDERNGAAMAYYPGGTVKWSGQFEDGLREGTWVFWHDNGCVACCGTYLHGLECDDDGSVDCDWKVGWWYRYNRLGELIHAKEYLAGASVVPYSR